MTFLPVFAKEVLHGGAATYTALLFCSGLGSICGALRVAGFGKTKSQGRTALLMLLAAGRGHFVFARFEIDLLSCVMIFFARRGHDHRVRHRSTPWCRRSPRTTCAGA